MKEYLVPVKAVANDAIFFFFSCRLLIGELEDIGGCTAHPVKKASPRPRGMISRINTIEGMHLVLNKFKGY